MLLTHLFRYIVRRISLQGIHLIHLVIIQYVKELVKS